MNALLWCLLCSQTPLRFGDVLRMVFMDTVDVTPLRSLLDGGPLCCVGPGETIRQVPNRPPPLFISYDDILKRSAAAAAAGAEASTGAPPAIEQRVWLSFFNACYGVGIGAVANGILQLDEVRLGRRFRSSSSNEILAHFFSFSTGWNKSIFFSSTG